MSVLDDILEGVRTDLAARQQADAAGPAQGGGQPGAVAPRRAGARWAATRCRVIAEVKRASPSKGALAAIADPAALAARLRGRRRAA